MKNEINELWKMMPMFYYIHNDKDFDKDFVFKGFTFILSLFLLPLTFIFWSVGKLLSKEVK